MNSEVVLDMDCLKTADETVSAYKDMIRLISINSGTVFRAKKEVSNEDLKLSEKIYIIWVMSDSCMISCDDYELELTENMFFVGIHDKSIRLKPSSIDFSARMIIVEKDFMEEYITNKYMISFFTYMFFDKKFSLQLDSTHIRALNENYANIQKHINKSANAFRDELIKINFFSFLVELSSILVSEKDLNLVYHHTHKEEIVVHFFDLLKDNFRQQHEVSFYSDKLFISSQYLTMVLRSATGKTTNRWIDEFLLSEAKTLLKTTNDQIQQIADNLYFSDQSTFGKFFKKYVGFSPAEYRKMNSVFRVIAQ